MSDRKIKINRGYKQNSNKYDDYITSRKWWSKLVVKFVWGMRDEEYVDTLLPLLSDDFSGSLLDIPVGTSIFTYEKYLQMQQADITCMDYSPDMLSYAIERLNPDKNKNIRCISGDVGNLPFEDHSFDVVFSMNGFHAFPDKEKAFKEVFRVLKPNGRFIGCFYVRNERRITDVIIRNVFVRNGTFTPPFMTKEEVKYVLSQECSTVKIWNVKSIVCFDAVKKM